MALSKSDIQKNKKHEEALKQYEGLTSKSNFANNPQAQIGYPKPPAQVAAEMAQKNPLPGSEQIPEISQIPNKVEQENRQKYEEAGQQINEAAKASKLNAIFTPEQVTGFEKTKYSISQVPIKQIGAEAYDAFHTLLTRKKPLKFTNAKEGFTNSIAIIQKNLDDAKLSGDYANARMDFENAVQSLHRLEASSKGFAQENLNWWIDDGISIQTEIELQREILGDLRGDLNIILQNKQLQQSRANILNAANAPR